jgi:N-acetylmuramoyl-L-alanine amidase
LIVSRALLRSVAVVRFRIWLATALAFGALVAGILRAQVNEEKRRDQSEETETRAASTAKPKKSPTPKTKRRHTPTPKPRTAKKKSGAKKTSGKSKKSSESKSARKEETPKPGKTPAAQIERARAASETPAPPPRAIAVPTPAPSPQPKPARAVPAGGQAQVVIEKSGIEEDQGFEPPPSPPPRRGFWLWSRPVSYRYLTSSVIDAIRRAPVKRRRWQFIVVHNSGTRQGNARVFDYYHKHVRRMQNGLAYHFVIGNGTSTGNGQIEVGDRWRRQINGGHVHSDYLNNISLGICLVGDFNRDQPTRAQLDACEELIRYLRDRCGKTERGTIPVKPHREMNPPRWATDCPGDAFPYSDETSSKLVRNASEDRRLANAARGHDLHQCQSDCLYNRDSDIR